MVQLAFPPNPVTPWDQEGESRIQLGELTPGPGSRSTWQAVQLCPKSPTQNSEWALSQEDGRWQRTGKQLLGQWPHLDPSLWTGPPASQTEEQIMRQKCYLCSRWRGKKSLSQTKAVTCSSSFSFCYLAPPPRSGNCLWLIDRRLNFKLCPHSWSHFSARHIGLSHWKWTCLP